MTASLLRRTPTQFNTLNEEGMGDDMPPVFMRDLQLPLE